MMTIWFRTYVLLPLSIFYACISVHSSSAQTPRHEIQISMIEYPPLAGSNLENHGFLPDLAKQVFLKLGYEIKITFKPWKRAYEDLKNGVDDAILAMWYREERKKHFKYGPVLYFSELVFIQSAHQEKVSLPENLSSYRLGITRGSSPPKEYLINAKYIEHSKDELTNIKKLSVGRIDIAYVETAVFKKLLKTKLYSKKDQFRIVKNSTVHEPLHLTFSNSSQYLSLIPKLKEELIRFRKTKEFTELLERHHIQNIKQ